MRALDVVAVSSPSLVALDVDADSPRSVDLSPEEAGSSKYRAPIAIDSEVSATAGNSVRFRLLAGDWPSPLAFSIVQAAKHGTLTCVQADQARGFKDHLTEFDDDHGVAWRFNVVMAMISCYWVMVVTNWAKADSGHAVSGVNGGTSVMWLNGAASWICMGLYTWTLVASRVMPGRDFS